METISINNISMAQVINDAIEISQKNDLDDLFRTIGNGLYDENLEVIEQAGKIVLEPKAINTPTFAMQSFMFVKNANPQSEEDNKQEGEKLFKRINTKIQKEICTNETIYSLFMKENNLKSALSQILPIVLAGIAVSLNAIGMAILIAILALIIKVGYETYCEKVWEVNPVKI